ncbi:MAG: HAMP domain-containing protein [Prevotella sp.]|nr:HAMP domain-containing protein [Prevotella sp.]
MNIIAKQVRRSFALRLSLSIVVMATIVFVVAIGELFYRSRSATKEAAISQATQVLSNVTQHMTALLSEVEVATQNTEWQVFENLQPDALLQLSRSMVELNPILDGCSIAMEPNFFKDQGKFFSAYSSRIENQIETQQEGNESYYYFGMDWYSLPMLHGKAIWIDPFPDSNDITGNNRGLIISYCKPLMTADGHSIGVISSDISLRKLTQELSQERLYPESYFVLSDSRGKIVASTKTDASEKEEGIDYRRNLVIDNQLPNTNWKLTIVCPKSDIFKGYYQLIYIVITIVIFGLLLLWTFCYFVVKRNVSRLQMLAATTQDMANGHFDTPIPQTRRKDDIGLLQNSFSVMQASLSEYVANLERMKAESKQRNQELMVAKGLAEASDKRKSAFIQDMSHQIRTPLNIISGFAQILCESHLEMSEEERLMLSRDVLYNGYIISTIIDNWSMTSALDKVKDLPREDLVTANVLCHEAVDNVLFKQRDEVMVNIETTECDIRLITDKKSVLKILTELLHNADKFTKHGTITIGCQQLNSQFMAFYVADTGCGISPDNQEHLFEPFMKVDEFSEGLGLGLPLCHRLATLLKGEIVLDTQYSGGARFLLKLPVS